MSQTIELDPIRLDKVLRDDQFRAGIIEVADLAYRSGYTEYEHLMELSRGDDVVANLAARMLHTKRIAVQVMHPLKLAVIVPMWRENRRLLPRSGGNPNGENSLHDKLAALQWLFEGTAITWQLYAVDDNCPEDSASIAQLVIDRNGFSDNASVLRLAEGFPYACEPLSEMASLEMSSKGGAVLRGFSDALDEGADLVFYTDSDNSIHIGQIGPLLQAVCLEGFDVATGDRWLDKTYLWPQGNRGIGGMEGLNILFHLRSLLGVETVVPDVVAPYKLFTSSILQKILPTLRRFDFCFDYDIAAALTREKARIATAPIIIFDSIPETSWNHYGHSQIWFQKLDGMISAARRFDLPHDKELANLVMTLVNSSADIARMIDAVPPPELVGCHPDSIGREEILSRQQTAEFIRQIFKS